VACSTGWTYEQIDGHTLADLEGLADYWRAAPPTHLLVRDYLGYKAPDGESAAESHPDDERTFEDLEAEADAALAGVNW